VLALVVERNHGLLVGCVGIEAELTSAKASLIIFGAALNLCLNSLGGSNLLVYGFWIWLRMVMLYVCSLLRCFLVVCFCT
jgi:hypothetical protein